MEQLLLEPLISIRKKKKITVCETIEEINYTPSPINIMKWYKFDQEQKKNFTLLTTENLKKLDYEKLEIYLMTINPPTTLKKKISLIDYKAIFNFIGTDYNEILSIFPGEAFSEMVIKKIGIGIYTIQAVDILEGENNITTSISRIPINYFRTIREVFERYGNYNTLFLSQIHKIKINEILREFRGTKIMYITSDDNNINDVIDNQIFSLEFDEISVGYPSNMKFFIRRFDENLWKKKNYLEKWNILTYSEKKENTLLLPSEINELKEKNEKEKEKEKNNYYDIVKELLEIYNYLDKINNFSRDLPTEDEIFELIKRFKSLKFEEEEIVVGGGGSARGQRNYNNNNSYNIIEITRNYLKQTVGPYLLDPAELLAMVRFIGKDEVLSINYGGGFVESLLVKRDILVRATTPPYSVNDKVLNWKIPVETIMAEDALWKYRKENKHQVLLLNGHSGETFCGNKIIHLEDKEKNAGDINFNRFERVFWNDEEIKKEVNKKFLSRVRFYIRKNAE